MTQKVLEIDVMVYNMTKNPKIYKKICYVKKKKEKKKKIFLVTVVEN